MSTLPTAHSASPESITDRSVCHMAHFTSRRTQASMAGITAHGAVDASNALEVVDYTMRHAATAKRLVLDLSGVEFFGTAGFSALHTVNVRCAAENVDWAVIPSAAVTRLLRICDPDSALPICRTVDAALSTLRAEPHRLLQLVSQSR